MLSLYCLFAGPRELHLHTIGAHLTIIGNVRDTFIRTFTLSIICVHSAFLLSPRPASVTSERSEIGKRETTTDLQASFLSCSSRSHRMRYIVLIYPFILAPNLPLLHPRPLANPVCYISSHPGFLTPSPLSPYIALALLLSSNIPPYDTLRPNSVMIL